MPPKGEVITMRFSFSEWAKLTAIVAVPALSLTIWLLTVRFDLDAAIKDNERQDEAIVDQQRVQLETVRALERLNGRMEGMQ